MAGFGKVTMAGTFAGGMAPPIPASAGASGGASNVNVGFGQGSPSSSYFMDATAGARTAFLPPAASAIGKIVNVKKTDASANVVTVQASGAETIDGTNTRTLTAQYQSVQIQSDGTTWWIL